MNRQGSGFALASLSVLITRPIPPGPQQIAPIGATSHEEGNDLNQQPIPFPKPDLFLSLMTDMVWLAGVRERRVVADLSFLIEIK
jgi:hypothetical protein